MPPFRTLHCRATTSHCWATRVLSLVAHWATTFQSNLASPGKPVRHVSVGGCDAGAGATGEGTVVGGRDAGAGATGSGRTSGSEGGGGVTTPPVGSSGSRSAYVKPAFHTLDINVPRGASLSRAEVVAYFVAKGLLSSIEVLGFRSLLRVVSPWPSLGVRLWLGGFCARCGLWQRWGRWAASGGWSPS